MEGEMAKLELKQCRACGWVGRPEEVLDLHPETHWLVETDCPSCGEWDVLESLCYEARTPKGIIEDLRTDGLLHVCPWPH